MLTSFASQLTAPTKCNLWIKLSWGPWKHSTAKKLKNDSVHTQDESSPLPNWPTIRKCIQASCNRKIAANDFRATGPFPCDKYIFRPYDFPLSSEYKDAAPLNHPALVKTSDETFSFVNFSPFTSTEALRSSDISPVPSLNLQPNTRGGTARKITSSLYRKFVGANQKKKMKQATKSKTSRLASNAFLGPSKRRNRRVCRDPNPSDTPSDSDTDLAVPLDDNSTEEEQDADCVYCTGHFSEDQNGED